MKQVSLLILLLIGFSTKAQDTTSIQHCKTNGFDSLDVGHVKMQLLGSWEYSYSFYKDSCFVLDKPIQLSHTYQFKMMDTLNMQKKMPWLYKFTKGKLLFGMVSFHESKSYGVKSYPTSGAQTNKKTGTLHIIHYVGDGPGKGYMYFLHSVDAENMILSDDVYYKTGTKKIAHVKHVYRRKK